MPLPEAPEPRHAVAETYRIRHTTRYAYGDEVSFSHHMTHLQARGHGRQRIRRSTVVIDPIPAQRLDFADFFSNPVTYLEVRAPHRQLAITAESEITVFAAPVPDLATTPIWERMRDRLRVGHGSVGFPAGAVDPYVCDSPYVRLDAALADYAAPSFLAGRPVGLAARDLQARIHADFTFDPTATTVATPLEEVLADRRGVCQDFAHLFIGCLRVMGLPARYVSGYLRTLPPPGQPRLVGADVSHAWASVWCGDGTWVDFCPTNDRLADTDYITLAWGRDYHDVSPVRGVVQGGAQHVLTVQVDVEPLSGQGLRAGPVDPRFG